MNSQRYDLSDQENRRWRGEEQKALSKIQSDSCLSHHLFSQNSLLSTHTPIRQPSDSGPMNVLITLKLQRFGKREVLEDAVCDSQTNNYRENSASVVGAVTDGDILDAQSSLLKPSKLGLKPSVLGGWIACVAYRLCRRLR